MYESVKINPKLKQEYIEKGYWLNKTLNDCWNEAVLKYPDNEYIVDDRGFRYTYKQLDIAAAKLANYLRKIGVGVGDTISYQMPIWSEFAIITIACYKIGAIANPQAMSYEKKELANCMNNTEAKVFFCATHFHKTNYEEQIISTLPEVKTLKNVILLDYLVEKTSDFPSFYKILEENEPLAVEDTYKGTGEDIALILGTSGTTSGPKGVILTHDNIRYAEEVFCKELELTEKDIMFMSAPLNQATGFHHSIIAPMFIGSKTVLQQKFHCVDSIDLMNKEKCTYSMGATPFIYDILRELDSSKKTIDSLKFYLCGGAPVPGYMVQKALEHKIILCEVYGSTESVPHAFVRPNEAVKLNGTTSGRALSGVEIRVVDENGNDVAFGEKGEELSRGPNVFVGYLKKQKITNEALDDDGWFHSGDLCTMDEHGNIKIIGRKKDMIVRGGENYDSNAINDTLEGCAGIKDHAVIGMPDQRLGEKICAFVVLKDGVETLTLKDVTDYLKSKEVSKRFWPERLEIIDKIPHTASGKVKKFILLEELERRIKNSK